jgi:O-succinylbenzoic acid--CoA ligase
VSLRRPEDRDPLAIPNPVASAALARPEHPVLVCGSETYGARALADAVASRAGALAADGIGPGVTVGLLGPPSADWVVAFHALGWVGAAVAPLPASATRFELERALEATGADRVLLTGGLSEEVLAWIRELAPDARFASELPAAEPQPERFWPLNEVRLVMLTSGTTDRPKPVPLTTAQLVFSAFGSAVRLGHDRADRWLACLPLHHIGGLSILVRCAFYGTSVVLHERFDPAAVARALDNGEATLVSLVPAMLERVLDARPERPFPPSLRAILVGGDRTPPELLERCRGIGAPLALTWGLTETASQVCTREPGDLRPDASVGPPLPFVRVTEEESGRLVVWGPLAGGRLETRDLGRVDADGRVTVDGRAEDVLVSGGETISLKELEAVLATHPSVAEVAVVAVPDAEWGERPVAALVARAGAERPDDDALREWCRERLAPFKVPRSFQWLDTLPRNALGKVDRPELVRSLGLRDEV